MNKRLYLCSIFWVLFLLVCEDRKIINLDVWLYPSHQPFINNLIIIPHQLLKPVGIFFDLFLVI